MLNDLHSIVETQETLPMYVAWMEFGSKQKRRKGFKSVYGTNRQSETQKQPKKGRFLW